MYERNTWPRYFMDIAYLVAQRSTCLRRKVGAGAVKDRRILATGYNGAPSGCRHCDEVGCLRQQLDIPSGQRQEICRAVHAEQNVIVQAAKHGISLDGAELYCTTLPCITCAKMLLNVGIRRICVVEGYPDELTGDLIKESGMELVYLKEADDA